MSDPQPQRPVSEAPKACLFSIVEGGREVFRVTPDGTQTLADDATPAELRAAIHYLGQAFHEAWNRRAVSEAPAAPERVRTAPPQEEATTVKCSHCSGGFQCWSDANATNVSICSVCFGSGWVRRPSTPSSAPTTEEKPHA